MTGTCSTAISQRQETSEAYEVVQLTHVVKVLGAELKTARAAIDKLKKELALFQTQKFDQQALEQQIKRLEQENQTLKSAPSREEASFHQTIDMLRKELLDEQKKNGLLEKSLEKERSQREASVKEDCSPQLARLALQLSKTQEEVHALSCERAALLRAHKDSEEVKAKLFVDLSLLQEKFVTHEQEQSETWQKQEQLTQDLQLLTTKCSLLTQELEEANKAFVLISQEYNSLQTRFDSTVEEKNRLELNQSVLSKELSRFLEIEGRFALALEEKDEIEKRWKETEEVLVVKLGLIAELEEETQMLSQQLALVEEAVKIKQQESAHLEDMLKKGQAEVLVLKEKIEVYSVDTEVLKRKLSTALQRLSFLDAWKKRVSLPIVELQAAAGELEQFEKQLEHHDGTKYRLQPSFSCDMSLFTKNSSDHDRLF